MVAVIGPVTNFSEIVPHQARRYPGSCDLPAKAMRDREAAAALQTYGLQRSDNEFVGRSLFFHDFRAGRRMEIREHSTLYTLVAPDEVLAGIRAHIAKIAALYGPGMLWVLDDPVHVVRDYGEANEIVLADVVGSALPHALLRTFYGHEAQAVPW